MPSPLPSGGEDRQWMPFRRYIWRIVNGLEDAKQDFESYRVLSNPDFEDTSPPPVFNELANF